MDTPTAAAALLLVAELAAKRPFTRPSLEERLGVTFAYDEQRSSPYFRVYVADRPANGGPFTRVELRLPILTRDATAKDGMILLDIAPGLDITQADVVAQFGPRAEPVPASPRAPLHAPNYLRYSEPWGKLSFGLTRTEPEHVTSVVIDATGK